MTVATANVLHGIANGSTFISQIENARPMPDIQELLATPSGLPFPLFVANLGQNPAIPFESSQVKTILDLSGALSSIADLSGANTDLLFKKVADLGRRVADATTEHTRLRMSQAFLVVDSITASHRSEAVASCRIGTTFDGTNAPIVAAGSVALSGTPTSAEHYVAGPVVLNTTDLDGVIDITINFQKTLIELGGDGELYNTFAALGSYAPIVTVRCYSHAWATFGLIGTALTAADFYFRKVAEDGTRVADATEEHIKFSATSGLIRVIDTTAGGNEAGVTTIQCTLTGANATTEPITVDTTSAIS